MCGGAAGRLCGLSAAECRGRQTDSTDDGDNELYRSSGRAGPLWPEWSNSGTGLMTEFNWLVLATSRGETTYKLLQLLLDYFFIAITSLFHPSVSYL